MAPDAEPLAILPDTPPTFTLTDFDRVPRSHALVSFDHDDNRSIQLLATSDARELVMSRLHGSADTPRTDLSQVTRALRVWPARCSLEADLLYARLAPQLVNSGFDELRKPIELCLLTADRTATHPRFRAVSSLAPLPSTPLVGPFTTRKRAEQFADDLVDLFDLCRKHELLVLAPEATACVYKELGKCPAACDGSETLERYRGRFEQALRLALGHPERALLEMHSQMNDASVALKFERAEKIRARIARITKMRSENNRLASDLRGSTWLAVSTCADQKSAYAAMLCAGHVVAESACARDEAPGTLASELCQSPDRSHPAEPHMPTIEILTRRFAKPAPREIASLFVLESGEPHEIESALTGFLTGTR